MKKLAIILGAIIQIAWAYSSASVLQEEGCTGGQENLTQPANALAKPTGKAPKIIRTMNYIPDEFEKDLRTLIECPGGAGAQSKGTDYFVYEKMFNDQFLVALTAEMKWIEEKYQKDFIDSNIKRAYGDFKDTDYANYHRISKVYWLTFIKEEDYVYLPNLVKFKDWIKILRASIDKQLYEAGTGFEVASIEEQFILYDQGGKFEAHLDTQCNPFTNCKIGTDHHYPRLLTQLIFLNPEWQESDGGTYHTYYNWPELELKEIVLPTLGKSVMIRADKVYHSAEWVHTQKRAVSLFINVKPITTELPA